MRANLALSVGPNSPGDDQDPQVQHAHPATVTAKPQQLAVRGITRPATTTATSAAATRSKVASGGLPPSCRRR